MNRLTWQIFRAAVNDLRQKRLSLPVQTYSGWQAATHDSPVLNAFSAYVMEHPADWPDNQIITGFWVDEPNVVWQPPDDLRAFLGGGDPPVCFTFGSMIIEDRAATQAALQTAQHMTGQRAIWIGDWDVPSNDQTFVTGSCPYSWLFPRVKTVIHHGGAGTFAAALHTGVPVITVPFLLDQFFWGEVAEQCGISPASIPHKRLNAYNLANAIHHAITDPDIRHRAAELGKLVQDEAGVNQAVAHIEATLTTQIPRKH